MYVFSACAVLIIKSVLVLQQEGGREGGRREGGRREGGGREGRCL